MYRRFLSAPGLFLGAMLIATTVHASDANKELVRRFAEISNNRQFDRLADILQSDFARHCQSTPGVKVTSLEEFKAFLNQDASTFPDSRVHLDVLVAEGDLVSFWGRYTGTQKGDMGPFPATGRSVEIDVSGVFRITEGKIAELWIVWDNLAVLAQLGFMPPQE